MRPSLGAAMVFCALTTSAVADEFSDVVESALAAYRAGDLTVAREELDYAVQLLARLKGESLAALLPEPPPGWTRDTAGAEDGGIAMAMLGGGATAAATYTDDEGDITITLLADSPMISGMAGMISGMASMGGERPIRIQRTQFGVTEGEMQGVVDGRVMISVSGSAPVEAKTALLEAMDFEALADF